MAPCMSTPNARDQFQGFDRLRSSGSKVRAYHDLEPRGVRTDEQAPRQRITRHEDSSDGVSTRIRRDQLEGSVRLGREHENAVTAMGLWPGSKFCEGEGEAATVREFIDQARR